MPSIGWARLNPFGQYSMNTLESHTEYISMAQYVEVVGRRWKILLLVSAFVSSISVVRALTVTVEYRLESIVAPASEGTDSVIDSVLGQASSLAAAIGLGRSGMGRSSMEAIVTLRSKGFLYGFIEKHKLLRSLYAGRWSEEDSEWRQSFWRAEPDLSDGYERFVNDVLSVDQDPESGFWVISLMWRDPYEAKKWLELLLAEVNELRRERDKVEAKEAVAYLEKRLSDTTNLAIRDAIYSLLESHLRIEMLVNVREEYALKIVSHPVVPSLDNFDYPNRLMIITFGIMGGLFLGLFWIFVREGTAVRQRESD